MKAARCLAVATLASFVTIAAAEDFDGSRPFDCTPLQGHDCLPDQKECKALEPRLEKSTDFKFDVQKKQVWSPYRNAELPIQHVSKNTASLVMQGTTLDVAWSGTVHLKTGRMTVVIADREGAYVVFGQCKAGKPAQ